MEEIWKDIVIEKNGVSYDFSGKYQVSNMGRVKSLIDNHGKYREHILKPRLNKENKYLQVRLFKGSKGKEFTVHRLVANAFIPNPNNLPIVNHKDENPSNNCVDNLEWCTNEYNLNYGTSRERLSEAKKGDKNPMYGRTGDKHPMYGKHHTEEWKQRQSEKMKGKGKGIKQPNIAGSKHGRARKVVCIETGHVFGCIKHAAEWCKRDAASIRMCCKGKQKTCAGYHWKYLEDYKKDLRMQSDIKNSQIAA